MARIGPRDPFQYLILFIFYSTAISPPICTIAAHLHYLRLFPLFFPFLFSSSPIDCNALLHFNLSKTLSFLSFFLLFYPSQACVVILTCLVLPLCDTHVRGRSWMVCAINHPPTFYRYSTSRQGKPRRIITYISICALILVYGV